MDDLNREIMANSNTEGYGLDVTQVMACPFCAEPDAMRMAVIKMATTLYPYTMPGSCDACGRKFEARVDKDENGSIMGQFFQTAGDDMPEWFQPPMPRSEPTV